MRGPRIARRWRSIRATLASSRQAFEEVRRKWVSNWRGMNWLPGSCNPEKSMHISESGSIKGAKPLMSNGTGHSGRLLAQERKPGRSYDLYDTGSAVDVYVDGSSGLLLGSTVAKLRFHTVVDATPSDTGEGITETRHLKVTLNIPLPQFVEFVVSSAKSLSEHRDMILKVVDEQRENLNKNLPRIAIDGSDS